MSTAKLHARLTRSSLMSTPVESRYLFLALIAMADPKGRVIGTDERIAVEAALDLPVYLTAMQPLLAPDAHSSSKLHEGRRLVPIADPRGYKIVNYAAYQGKKTGDPKKCPTTVESLAIAAIFRRRQETEWATKEIAAYKELVRGKKIVLEEVELIARYYEAERKKTDRDGKECGYHRRDLSTFLNNYQGELDRAREWARRFPQAAARPLKPVTGNPATVEKEPEGFRAWFTRAYSKADPETPFGQIPLDIRRAFQP